MSKAIVVIDPGHGGQLDLGGSSKNNAVSPSGVLEKNIALRFAFLIRDALEEAAQVAGQEVQIILTRESDVNRSLADRATVARTRKADLFLSVHFNGFNGVARGTETLISPKAVNSNLEADRSFARRIQKAVVKSIKAHDPNAKNRGVKEQKLSVLNDAVLGPKPRACLLEVEFIDVPEVDTLLNIGPNSPAVREDICKAIAGAILEDLAANQ